MSDIAHTDQASESSGTIAPRHDIFISYSHAGSQALARSIQSGLEKLLRRWYQLRSFKVFRDETNLSLHPELWPEIERELAASRLLLVLLTPEAARADGGVEQEVAWWLEHRGKQSILLVHASGRLAWDRRARAFDPTTDALPPSLAAAYQKEPGWLDLTWAAGRHRPKRREERFHKALVAIGAAAKNVPPEVIDSEARRALRANRLWAWGAALALAAALGAAAYQGLRVWNSRILESARLLHATSPSESYLALRELAGTDGNEVVLPFFAQETLSYTPLTVARHSLGEAVGGIAVAPSGYGAATFDGIAHLWSSNGAHREIPGRSPISAAEKTGYGDKRVPLSGVVFLAGGGQVATVDWKGCVRLFAVSGSADEWEGARQKCVNATGDGYGTSASDPTGNFAYVHEGEIVVLRADGKVTHALPVREHVAALAVAANGTQLVVRLESGAAFVLDISSGSMTDIGLDVAEVGTCNDGKAWIARKDNVRFSPFEGAWTKLAGKPPWKISPACSLYVDSEGVLFRRGTTDPLARNLGRAWNLAGRGVSVAFSGDDRVAAANPDGSITLFDVAGKRTSTLLSQSSRVFALVFSPDGSRLLSGGLDPFLRIFDARGGLFPPSPAFPGAHSLYATDRGIAVAAADYIGPDLTEASADKPQKVVASLTPGGPAVETPVPSDWKIGAKYVLFDTDGMKLLVCRKLQCPDGSVERDMPIESRVSGALGHARASADGRFVAVTEDGERVRVYALERPEPTPIYVYESGGIADAAFDKDGLHLVILDGERLLRAPVTLTALARAADRSMHYCLTPNERMSYLHEWEWLAKWRAKACAAEEKAERS